MDSQRIIVVSEYRIVSVPGKNNSRIKKTGHCTRSGRQHFSSADPITFELGLTERNC